MSERPGHECEFAVHVRTGSTCMPVISRQQTSGTFESEPLKVVDQYRITACYDKTCSRVTLLGAPQTHTHTYTHTQERESLHPRRQMRVTGFSFGSLKTV